MNDKIALDRLDPARTALVVVHMAKGVAGPVDTPFNRLFRQRAKDKGVITTQQRLLNEFRKAKAKVVYTFVAYQQGLPGVKPKSPLFRTLFECNCLLQGTPAVEPIDDIAPLPNEPVVRGQACNGFEDTPLETILQAAGVDTLVFVGIATDVAVESTVRGASDRQYRTIVVSDACTADSDETHVRALDTIQKWFAETPTADEVLRGLGQEAPTARSLGRTA